MPPQDTVIIQRWTGDPDVEIHASGIESHQYRIKTLDVKPRFTEMDDLRTLYNVEFEISRLKVSAPPRHHTATQLPSIQQKAASNTNEKKNRITSRPHCRSRATAFDSKYLKAAVAVTVTVTVTVTAKRQRRRRRRYEKPYQSIWKRWATMPPQPGGSKIHHPTAGMRIIKCACLNQRRTARRR